ncbi:MAG: hypothetical protein KBT47_01815 [Armatimonadetes bacterium]|nr:hypothetical protein [Candidatus Hippobium faecium]
MKKIITLLLGLCLCFALMGCGGSGSSSSEYIEEESGSATAIYENGNLIIPIKTYPKRRPRLEKRYTVKSDKCTWYIKCFTGVNTPVTSGKRKIILPNKDSVVTVPEKYANDDYHIITWCSYMRGNKNVPYEYHILIRKR